MYWSSASTFRWCNGACQNLNPIDETTNVDQHFIDNINMKYEFRIGDYPGLDKGMIMNKWDILPWISILLIIILELGFNYTLKMVPVCVRDPSKSQILYRVLYTVNLIDPPGQVRMGGHYFHA